MKQSRKGLIMVMISGFVYGTMPSLVTLCYEQGATSTIVLLFRYAILSVIFFPATVRAKNSIDVLKKNWRSLLALMLFAAITPLLLYNAYNYLPTGVVTTIHFLYPTVVMLMCIFIFHEKISKIKLVCVTLCVVGVLLLLDLSAGQKLSSVGLILTALSSLTWGCYIVGLDKFKIGEISKEQLLFFIEFGNLLITGLIYGPISGTLNANITLRGWFLLIGTNLVISILGTMMFTIGVRYTDAQVSAIASTLEPITSIFVGVLFLHESFTSKTAIGSVMILTAVVLLALWGDKEK